MTEVALAIYLEVSYQRTVRRALGVNLSRTSWAIVAGWQ